MQCTLGCQNPATLLPLAFRVCFTQPLTEKYALQSICTCNGTTSDINGMGRWVRMGEISTPKSAKRKKLFFGGTEDEGMREGGNLTKFSLSCVILSRTRNGHLAPLLRWMHRRSSVPPSFHYRCCPNRKCRRRRRHSRFQPNLVLDFSEKKNMFLSRHFRSNLG